MSRMVRTAAFVLVAVSVVGAAVAIAASGAKTGKSGKMTPAERGKYLVSVMGCGDCHTPGTFYGAPIMSRFLAGGEMGWAGPWGVVYARNLTPDPETGLGKWTPEQMAHVIRTGNRPDGRQLAPIMPWMNFANLTDEDVMAIVAYLRSLPAVKHKVPDVVPPDQVASGPVLSFPPPSAWDLPPASAEGH
jgi:mono/diheme cytochrome c family protein